MKNLNKLIRKLQSYYWLGLYCSILQAQVVISEFFINSAEGTQIPQYIELHNKNSYPVPLENWSIITKNENGQESSLFTVFNSDNDWVTIHNSALEIEPNGYFLISSNSIGGFIFSNNRNSDIEVLFILSEAGSIYLLNDDDDPVDQIVYDISESNWPIKTGYSTILQLSDDTWSLSPETENSVWLYEGSDPINFGSPQEENAFKLNNIQYSDSWFPDTSYANGDTHTIYGDVIDFYRAEPFVDENGNGKCDYCGQGEVGELYHDRNLNNKWDHQDNNYNVPLAFSWVGTFIDNSPAISYEIIIKKQIIVETSDEAVNDTIWVNIPDTSWLYIPDTSISILPFNFLIDSLVGIEREIVKYSWTVELTKIFSNGSTDTIYSDKYTFTIDASDYGIYGCVDDGHCTGSETNDCPTDAFYEESYISKHPTDCTPGEDCLSAINYHETANINSNTCHYVSLSLPAFVLGDVSDTVSVPVYLHNDSLANIDSIAYTLSFDNSSGILSYESGTFSGTVISELGDENIDGDQNGNISVNIPISSVDDSFAGAGIITYLYFDSVGAQGEYTDLTLSEVKVKGGFPINDITVPVSGGEVVILQTDYEIYGQAYYYDSSTDEDPFQVPDVEITLAKKYDGNPAATVYTTTNEDGFFKFASLMEGNYNLSFSKGSNNDCNGNYISGTDVSRIKRHVIGSVPFNADQIIAADVSLDGTVSGLDASLVARYSVDLIYNFNDIPTHWIFKPFDEETLPNVHAELLKHNGQYSIEYKPLVLDDTIRNISAYRLGDVNGNYCNDEDQSRYKNDNLQFKDIIIEYKPVISLPIILSESVYVQGIDIEIGYDKDIFDPLSISFNSLNQQSENYESLSNLFSHEGSIKTVTWAADDPQLISGIIGEVSFSWENNNEAGKIWLNKFFVNDAYAIGGLKLPDIDDDEIAEGLNIINELYPEVLSLKQNYPNPFNPQTSIFWSMPGSGKASIDIYNLKGQFIDILYYGYKEPGSHEIIWNASAYPSGIYFYRLTIGETVLQKKMILLR